MNKLSLTVVASTVILQGCGISGPIKSAQSPSGFEGAVYSGRTDTLNKPTPGLESYRVFNQAATGFSTADAQMGDAYERAGRFCNSNGKKMRALEESRSTGLHALGNFPRAELVFECVSNGVSVNSQTPDDKYTKLAKLKALLDSGAITSQEFDREKSTILSQP